MYGYTTTQMVVSLVILFFSIIGVLYIIERIQAWRLKQKHVKAAKPVSSTTGEYAPEPRVYSKLNMGSDVLVLERRGNMIVPVWGKLQGRTIVTKERPPRTFIVPESYNPMLLFRRRLWRKQAVLAYLADEKGNLIEWNDNFEAATIDPAFLGTVLNTEILQRLAATVFIRPTQIISWLLSGLGIAFILIFIVFPMLGIHVQIGSQPIVVNPHVTVQQPPAPPPGNYTIQP